MNNQAKPCPHCGGPAELKRYHADNTRVYYGCADIACHYTYESPQEALEAWNRRADDPAPAAVDGSGGEYYILSLKHSPADGFALWWGPNNAGYTTNLANAGRYAAAAVEAARDYYDNGTTTRAVKRTDAERMVTRAVDWGYARKTWGAT